MNFHTEKWLPLRTKAHYYRNIFVVYLERVLKVIKLGPLTLSLPECLIEFYKVTHLLSMWTKSYDVNIQMKALCLNSCMVLFVFQNFTK